MVLELKPNTGKAFIDVLHPVLMSTLSDLRQMIAEKKHPGEMVDLFDQLETQLEIYVNCKNECQKQHDCHCSLNPETSLSRFKEFRESMMEFGATMPPSATLVELDRWTELFIFNTDKKCIAKPPGNV